eukprot:Gb_40871 [translate_table: standard]
MKIGVFTRYSLLCTTLALPDDQKIVADIDATKQDLKNTSSNSSQDSVIPALEPSSNLASGCSNKGKVSGHFDDICWFNCSSNKGYPSNVQLRRATRLGSLEAYSVFARRLGCEQSNVDQNQGFHVDYLRNNIVAQHAQENRLLIQSKSTLNRYRIHSTRMRSRQYSFLPFDILEWKDASFESANVIQIENMNQPHVMANNSNQSILTMTCSSSMTMEAQEARQGHLAYQGECEFQKNS